MHDSAQMVRKIDKSTYLLELVLQLSQLLQVELHQVDLLHLGLFYVRDSRHCLNYFHRQLKEKTFRANTGQLTSETTFSQMRSNAVE